MLRRAVLIVTAIGCSAGGRTSSDEHLKGLSKLVAVQSARIQALEAQLKKSAPCSAAKVSRAKGASKCLLSDSESEPEIQAFRLHERQRAAAKRQALLTPVFNVSVGSPLTAIAVSTGMLDRKGVPRLVAAADSSGTLFLFDREGGLSYKLPPSSESSAAVVSSIVIGPKEDPFVATGTLGGQVFLYNLTLPRLGHSSTADSAGAPSTSLNLAMHTNVLLTPDGAPAPVRTLDTYPRGRRTLLVIGDDAGTVRLVYRNGTERSTINVGGSIIVLERNKEGSLLGVAASGKGIILYDLTRPAPMPLNCEDGDDPAVNSAAEIISLAWDVHLPQLMYAGTDAGEIRIYNSRARVRTLGGEFGNESRLMTSCKLVTTIVGHQPAAVSVATLKGYLLSAAPTLFAVHNVSGLYGRQRDEPAVYLGRSLPPPPPGLMTFMASTRVSHVAVGGGARGELMLLASQLPFKELDKASGSFSGFEGGSGPAWILRNPIVLGGVMMLVFWQTSKMWRGTGDGGGRGGGDGDIDDETLRALEAIRKVSTADGRGFGSDVGDFGRGRDPRRTDSGQSRIEELDR